MAGSDQRQRRILRFDFKSLFLLCLRVEEDGVQVASVAPRGFSSTLHATIDGVPFRIGPRRGWGGGFVLESGEDEVARVESVRDGSGSMSFVSGGPRTLTLVPEAKRRDGVRLMDGESQIGTVRSERRFSRSFVADLPRDMPLVLAVFVGYLYLFTAVPPDID